MTYYEEVIRHTLEGLCKTGFKVIYTGRIMNTNAQETVLIDPETHNTITITENQYEDQEELWNVIGFDEEDLRNKLVANGLRPEEVEKAIEDENNEYMQAVKEFIKQNQKE